MITTTHIAGSRLDYSIDFTTMLQAGETIASSSVTPVDAKTTVTEPELVGGRLFAKIFSNTIGPNAQVRFEVVTNQGRTLTQYIGLDVQRKNVQRTVAPPTP